MHHARWKLPRGFYKKNSKRHRKHGRFVSFMLFLLLASEYNCMILEIAVATCDIGERIRDANFRIWHCWAANRSWLLRPAMVDLWYVCYSWLFAIIDSSKSFPCTDLGFCDFSLYTEYKPLLPDILFLESWNMFNRYNLYK